MKIPLYLPPCKTCGLQANVWIHLHDQRLNYKCPCGTDRSGSLDPNITIGFRGLYRSEYELNQNNDHILSIVFSALALEWEIVKLHNKWIHIDALDRGKFLSTEQLESALRKHRTIYEKIKATGELLHVNGFEMFARNNPDFYKTIEKSFPSLNFNSLIHDIEKNIFWPRNRILHTANTNFHKDDAIKAYNISYLGLLILRTMDEYRRNSQI